MPMMKTASVGTTNITNIQKYLMKEQRQEVATHQREWEDFISGKIQLSNQQAGRLEKYLGQNARGLAVDVSDDVSVRNWARQMDLTRALYQHDKPAKQGRSRSYYHFILSPNPNDDFTLATLRAYSKAWCEENFRQGERLHEYAIVYHDDNAKGVLHAHVVVNVSNKKTGKKLHIDNDQAVALELSAQSIGRRFGLSPIREQMQTTVGARTTQPVYLDRKEREILNKGGYSWKWELRKFISDVAPLSKDFNDFQLRMSRAGYNVQRSEETGYLTYMHRNGLKVKDSRLGSRFYLESLERLFNHEQLLADQTYTAWELMRISKGEVSWKEDIRRAIDAVAPAVLSVPELQRELEKRYGIQVSINRRGITYHHASGFKARDISLGCRYTLAGLRHNAVVGCILPYPDLEDVQQGGRFVSRHYIPRGIRATSEGTYGLISSQAVYQDISKLMARYDLIRLDDLSGALNERYGALREAKMELNDLRYQVMRWNHLAVLQSRCDRDFDLLTSEKIARDVDLYNETLLRYKRIKLYLKEQIGEDDPKAKREELSALYEKRLDAHQAELNQLQHDMAVYQNYLVGKSIKLFPEGELQADGRIDVQQLVAASRTLSKHRIRDYYHLEKTLSEYETRLDLAQFKMKKATAQKLQLEIVRNDIRTYEEAKSLLPKMEALLARSSFLDLEAQEVRFQEAARRLAKAGVAEIDFAKCKEDYIHVLQDYIEMSKELSRLTEGISELKEAQNTCQAVADTIKGSSLNLSPNRKVGADGGDSVCLANNEERVYEELSGSIDRMTPVVASNEDIPFEEARRRHRERAEKAPERSRKRNNWLIR